MLRKRSGYSVETINAMLLLDIKRREEREYARYRKHREPKRSQDFVAFVFFAPFALAGFALVSRLFH